jgi:hypothetical protein
MTTYLALDHQIQDQSIDDAWLLSEEQLKLIFGSILAWIVFLKGRMTSFRPMERRSGTKLDVKRKGLKYFRTIFIDMIAYHFDHW